MDLELIRRLQENDESLQTLDLMYKSIGDAGAVALADALKQNTSLKFLSLGNGSIDTSILYIISTRIEANRDLLDIISTRIEANRDQSPNRFKKSKRGSARRVEKSPLRLKKVSVARKSSKRSPVRVKRLKSSVRRKNLSIARRVEKSPRRKNIKSKSKSGPARKN